MGDFNNVLHSTERIGAPVQHFEIVGFQNCVDWCGMQDVKQSGQFFTWSNKQDGLDRVMCKLDRVMFNADALDLFPDAIAEFQPEGLFDHSPCVVRLSQEAGQRKGAFKFFNMWVSFPRFEQIVANHWKIGCFGVPMYRVVSKLKGLKPVLRDLNREYFSEIEQRAAIAQQHLLSVQVELQQKPYDADLRHRETQASAAYAQLKQDKFLFLKQKAKLEWIQEGDANSAFFHSSLKTRRSWNKVLSIQDRFGRQCSTQDQIEEAFLDFYKSLLGSARQTAKVSRKVIDQGERVSEVHRKILLEPVTDEEIRKMFFEIPDDKAPGPDGYNSLFFKKSWNVIGEDVCEAIKRFFSNGKLLKQVNATVISLIPKVAQPSSVTEFRPIACCNVIYKVITKLLCLRLGRVLPEIICENQSAFVKGRTILDNILICQDLVRLYNRKSCSPRCMLKIDLKKAYDSVEWSFVRDMMENLGFPGSFVDLVMVCVESPLLFTLCMDYLSRILRLVGNMDGFRFHPLCKGIRLNHLVFADDLVLFCKGQSTSMRLLIRGFLSFSRASGLEMNQTKSEVVFNGVSPSVVQEFLACSGFKQGKLPFKYLGVPICPRRLSLLECNQLCEKIVARIGAWGSRKLSYAGRLVLVNSVLSSLHRYWAQIFLLPKGVIKKIEAICRNYLWEGHEHYSRGAPVAWADVCKEKKFGGLGVVDAGVWNTAAIGKLVWWITQKADHLWVKWVHHIYIKQANWYDYSPTNESSWSWRKICSVKEKLKAIFSLTDWQITGPEYSVKKGYAMLKGESERPVWARKLWSRYVLPKHAFISWLGFLGRLYTHSRMHRLGIPTVLECSICGTGIETWDHLLHDCEFSRSCLQQLQDWLGLRFRLADVWLHERWGRKWSLVQRQVVLSSSCALAYLIWDTRNRARIEAHVSRPVVILKKLKSLIEKAGNMAEKASNAAQSAKESMQEAGSQMQAKARGAADAVKDATGMNK